MRRCRCCQAARCRCTEARVIAALSAPDKAASNHDSQRPPASPLPRIPLPDCGDRAAGSSSAAPQAAPGRLGGQPRITQGAAGACSSPVKVAGSSPGTPSRSPPAVPTAPVCSPLPPSAGSPAMLIASSQCATDAGGRQGSLAGGPAHYRQPVPQRCSGIWHAGRRPQGIDCRQTLHLVHRQCGRAFDKVVDNRW